MPILETTESKFSPPPEFQTSGKRSVYRFQSMTVSVLDISQQDIQFIVDEEGNLARKEILAIRSPSKPLIVKEQTDRLLCKSTIWQFIYQADTVSFDGSIPSKSESFPNEKYQKLILEQVYELPKKDGVFDVVKERQGELVDDSGKPLKKQLDTFSSLSGETISLPSGNGNTKFIDIAMQYN